MFHHNVNRPSTLLCANHGAVLELPLDAAVERAQRWWLKHQLLEDLDPIAVEDRTQRILHACERLGIRDFSEILESAEKIICTATGVQHLTEYPTNEASEVVHGVRNHLGALLAAVAQSAREDAKSAGKDADSAGEDPEIARRDLPYVARRAGGLTRPCRDDEILLMRQRSLRGIGLNGRHRLVACQYALVESGAWPSETTTICPADFDDPRTPTKLDLPRVEHVAEERTVPLPEWARPILATALDAHVSRSPHAIHWPLMYSGSHSPGGNKASASASGNLGRAMQRAGLTKDRPQPVSILRWRAELTLRDQGGRAACDLVGKTAYKHLFDFIGPSGPHAVRNPKKPLHTFLGH